MGCDIHAHLEVRIKGEWLYYSPIHIYRNYLAFARMAGVRNSYNVVPIDSSRGLPDDVTRMTKLHSDDYGIDGHSHSWLSYDELVALIDWLQENDPRSGIQAHEWTFLGESAYLFGNGIYHWKKYPEDYPNFIEDIRLVFWFDN